MPVLSVRLFAPLMKQRVQVAPLTGYDSHGDKTFGAAVTYQAAVVGGTKLVRNQQGQEVPSRQTVYLMSNAAIRPVDQLTLSTEDTGSTELSALRPLILSVDRFPFVRGQFCTCLYLE